jgi:Zn-dependent M32 family carboxypeptidase
MKKIIRLNESDLRRIVNRVIRETTNTNRERRFSMESKHREIKPFLTEQEEKKANIRFIELVTKYKDDFQRFISVLTEIVNQDPSIFCKDINQQVSGAIKQLDTLIANIAKEENTTDLDSVIESLYKRFNQGLGKVIINVSAPIVKRFTAEKGEFFISSEILDAINNHLKTKYTKKGGEMISLVKDVIEKLGLTIEPSCQQKIT